MTRSRRRACASSAVRTGGGSSRRAETDCPRAETTILDVIANLDPIWPRAVTPFGAILLRVEAGCRGQRAEPASGGKIRRRSQPASAGRAFRAAARSGWGEDGPSCPRLWEVADEGPQGLVGEQQASADLHGLDLAGG